jgi:hypothetical protein
MLRTWPVLLLLAATACGDDGSATEDSTGSTGATSDSGSTAADGTTGVDLCAECAPPVPADWIGPVVTRITLTQVTIDCAPEMPDEVDIVRNRVEPEPAECACECGKPSGGCGPVTATYHDAAACDGMEIGTPTEAAARGCTNIADSADLALGLSLSASEPTTACPPMPMAGIPTVAFKDKLVACGGATMECEGGGTCIPDIPHPMGICIMRDGDEACPAEYPTKETWYREIDDTRECSQCTCEAAFSCGGTVDLFPEADCAGEALGTLDLDTCTPTTFMAGEMPSVQFTPELTGECTPVGGEASGDAVPSEPVTVCCTA